MIDFICCRYCKKPVLITDLKYIIRNAYIVGIAHKHCKKQKAEE